MAISDNHSLKHMLIHRDRIILTAFALYGLVGGSVFSVSDLSSERGAIFHPASAMNFPAILLVVFINIYLFNGSIVNLSSYPIAAIPIFTILWAFIGLMIYGLVRMLRLDSKAGDLK